jgi:peptidoglycan/xylan/chitin deacetylase (PgdA/CDA1 family)
LNNPGIFTISLDFELHWGGFEKWPLEKYRRYFLNTREVIPQMLSLFAEHDVHVTWATVGMLFHETREELMDNSPDLKPTYKMSALSAYQYISRVGIGQNEDQDPFHYAPSLIQQIINTPGQELGTHTFAHYYCNEEGQNVDQFRADLQAAQRAAGKFNTKLTSLVFPRNQFNDEYLRVCFEEGITAVRSNPLDWFWNIQSTQNESAWKRLNRGLDAYFPIGKKNTYKLNDLSVRPGYPVCLPASRLLRPYRPKEFFLNDLKISRIKSEMERAAKKGEVYHLWWHPHNFGNYPQQSMNGLQKILNHYKFCREHFNMESLTMGETVSRLNHGK